MLFPCAISIFLSRQRAESFSCPRNAHFHSWSFPIDRLGQVQVNDLAVVLPHDPCERIEQRFDVVHVVIASRGPVHVDRHRKGTGERLAVILAPRFPSDRLLVRAAPGAENLTTLKDTVEGVGGEGHCEKRYRHALSSSRSIEANSAKGGSCGLGSEDSV